MFSRNLGMRAHLKNLDFRSYLLDIKGKVLFGDYSELRAFAQSFEKDVPKQKGPIRVYNNYCAFRHIAKEFGGIEKTVAAFKKTAEGDEQALETSLTIISSLLDYLKEAA